MKTSLGDFFADNNGKPVVKISRFLRGENKGKYTVVEHLKEDDHRSGEILTERFQPVTKALEDLLNEIATIQESKGIHSEYVFVNADGSFASLKGYCRVLNHACKSIGLEAKGSYAFRKSLNNELVNGGLSNKTSGAIIGNTAFVNETNYTHESQTAVEDARVVLERRNALWEERVKEHKSSKSGYNSYTFGRSPMVAIIKAINAKKESSKTQGFQAFLA